MDQATHSGAANRNLPPVSHRGTWIAWGLALQAIGVGIPVTVALRSAEQHGLLGSVTHYSIRLIWHEMLRSRIDITFTVFGVAVFVVGGVVFARPFVRRRSTLYVAVPLTAALAVGVLGLVALICTVVFAAVSGSGDSGWAGVLNNVWFTGGRRRRRK